MSNSNVKFQFYPAKVESNRPLGYVNLEYFIKSIKNPKPQTIDIFEKIKLAEENNDMELKADLKQNNLFYFTPCVNVDGFRRYKNITKFTGVIVLDFDHIDNAIDLKSYLFSEYKFIIAAWLSPSRHGVKCLVNIPIVNTIDEFKAHWFAINKEFETFDGWDCTTKNAVLPLFQSYDYDILYRDNATKYMKTAEDPKRYDPIRKNIPINPEKLENMVFKIAETSIQKISDPGHPQLRSACIALGGYVAGGYIGYNELLNYVYQLIETNSYLQKGISGYQKTAKWSIDEGMKKPIIINRR